MAKIPRPPLKSLIDHIDHIAKVAGVDHVGLGSDFDGVSRCNPAGIDSAADLPKITQALLDRGYSADDIKKILGGNILRVFRQVEGVSREMQVPVSLTQALSYFAALLCNVAMQCHMQRYNATLRTNKRAQPARATRSNYA